MAKGRSPNCPTLTLREALDRGRRVYTEEHTHVADKKVIAEDLGYSSISGASASVIGALRQYGVLEGRGEGLRISEDAVTAFEMPVGSPEHSQAVKRLAFNPTLFQELQTQYGDRLPGEANLRHLLIKKGFLPATADDVISTYRDNLELVGGTDQEYNTAEEQPMRTETADRVELKDSVAMALKPALGLSGVSTHIFSWPLSKDITAEVRFSGAGELASSHFERLRKYLELAKETWLDEEDPTA